MVGTIVNFTTMHEYTCIAKTFDLNNLPVTSLITITIFKVFGKILQEFVVCSFLVIWIDHAAICSCFHP